MALTITATITVNDDEAYTDRESAILSAIANHPAGTGRQTAIPAVEAPAAAPAEETAAPAEEKPKRTRAPRTPKAAPAADSEASSTPAVLDTTLDTPAEPAAEAAAEPAAEEAPAEDLLGGGDAEEYTLERAVGVATAAINAGNQAQVKTALAAIAGGPSRVSELKGNAAGLEQFITALAA